MAATVDHGGITFDADFRWARVAGCDVSLTRSDRLLLRAFTGQPGRLLSRTDLLDAISGPGSSTGDRNIDFAVNRLRRKLGDDARNPRLIATRYGEGYVWVAQPRTGDGVSGAFITVGPLSGVDAATSDRAAAFGSSLAGRLNEMTDPARPVVFDPDFVVPAGGDGATAPQFTVGLSFLLWSRDRLDCSVTLWRRSDGHVLKVFRIPVAERPDIAGVATTIVDAIWMSFAHPAVDAASADDVPLPIRLVEAAEQMGASYAGSWRDGEQRLRETLARNPDDAQSRLMLATAIHSKYVLSGADILAVSDPRQADEAEIETLVTTALPVVEGNSIHVLMAAKLLDFVSPIYADFALQLAERAFAGTTAFAAAFATLGQLRMHRGDTGEAVRLFRLGSELAKPNSYFSYYLRVLLCEALLAAGDTQALSTAVEPLFMTEPLRRFFAFFYPPPAGMDVGYDIEAALEGMSLQRVRAAILNRHYVSVRRHSNPHHRQNIIGHIAGLMIGHRGPGVVPDEVFPDLPPTLQAAIGKPT